MKVGTRQSVQRAARALRSVIERGGPWDDATLSFLQALDPILMEGEQGKLDPPLDEEDFPNPYDFRDPGLDDLRELDAALAKFSSELVGSDEAVLGYLQSLIDREKGESS